MKNAIFRIVFPLLDTLLNHASSGGEQVGEDDMLALTLIHCVRNQRAMFGSVINMKNA